MRRLRLFAVLLPVVGLLAACSVTISLPFPVTPAPVSASNTGASPVAGTTLQPGASAYYEIDVSSTQQAAYPLLQVELDHNLDLTLYGPSAAAEASSSSPDLFAPGLLGLSALAPATSAPAPQGIVLTRTCAGSCVIEPLNHLTYYVRVENQGSSAVSFNLYAFVRPYDDANEPGNNTITGAVPLASGSSGDSGAIETLGDVDFWSMTASGTVTFDASNLVNERAAVIDGVTGATVITLNPGDSTSVNAGDVVRVYSASGDAAVSGKSVYYLTLN